MRPFMLLGIAVLAPVLAQAIPVADPTLCYRARPIGVPMSGGGRSTVDRYADSAVELGAADRLCAPASYENVGSTDGITHLLQRRARTAPGAPEPRPQRARTLETLFGTLTVDLVHARWVGVPARVDPTAAPPAPASYDMNHFRCWSARVTPGTAPLPGDRTVEIDDPYSVAPRYRLGRLERICTPANVDGADTIKHPTANLACFRGPAAARSGCTGPARDAAGARHVGRRRREARAGVVSVRPGDVGSRGVQRRPGALRSAVFRGLLSDHAQRDVERG